MDRYQEIGKYISIIQRMNHIYVAKYLNEFQIGCGQQFFLLQIDSHPGMTLQQLAYHGYYDKATATRAVKKLEEEGYVRMEVDQADKRARHIYVTDKARPVIAGTKSILENWMEILLSGFTDREKCQADEFLRRMASNVHHCLRNRERDEE